MTAFDRTWNPTYEGVPADNEDVTLGAGRIRNLKVDVRERLIVDHSWAGDTNDGKHNWATLRPQAVAPTLDAGDAAVYSHVQAAITELFYKDSNGTVTQITSNGGVAVPATITGSFTITGDLTVNGPVTTVAGLSASSAAITGAVSASDVSTSTATIGSTLAVNGIATFSAVMKPHVGITEIMNDPNFVVTKIGGNNAIGFTNNTYIQYNAGLARIEVFVGGVLVAHFP